MKRDLELIRLLLQEAEGENPKPDLSAYSEEAILYHYELMEEAELVIADFIKGQSGSLVSARIERLTNAGHDFLDAARNETIWKSFKQKIVKLGGGISIPVAVELLKELAKKHFGF